MFRACAAIAAFVGFLAPVMAAPPTATSAKASPDPKSLEVSQEELSRARELVQKLGSDTFRDREEAEHELAGMGRLARAALLDAVNLDPDPEVRHRAGALLPKATAEEMQARLDTFLADTKAEYDHNLPGWQQLRAVVRGEWTLFGWTHATRPNLDKAARELFIEFMQAPGGRQTLMALDRAPSELGQFVAMRKQEIYNAKYPRRSGLPVRNPGIPEIMGVFFAESQVNSKFVPKSMVLTALLQQAGVNAGLLQGADDRAKALRAVMAAWIDSRTEPNDMTTAMSFARTMLNDNAAAGRIAARMVNTAGITGFQKSSAIQTVVQLGLKEQVPALEKATTDKTVVTTLARQVNGKLGFVRVQGMIRETIEVRDVALAGAILLTDQNPEDYGFDKVAGLGTPAGFTYTRAKIADHNRASALEKWKQWREKNP